MIRISAYILLGLTPLLWSATRPNALPRPLIRTELAFNLMPHWPGAGNTFALVDRDVRNGTIHRIREITKRDFILVASGNQKSRANPEQVNLFEQYGISGCHVAFDDAFNTHHIDCPSIDALWKLRFQKKPLVNAQVEDLGWAHKANVPSDRQVFLLRPYGIKDMDDFAIGEDAFRLIRDANDPVWVSNYK